MVPETTDRAPFMVCNNRLSFRLIKLLLSSHSVKDLKLILNLIFHSTHISTTSIAGRVLRFSDKKIKKGVELKMIF